MQNLLNRIIKISIYLLVFLVPLFWLPFSFEAFEFNKQYLLFFLVSLAFFAWLARMIVVDKEIRFRRSPLDIFVLIFLFVAILSTIFSADKVSSLFGFYGRFSDGLIGLLSLGALYFLITNNVKPQMTADELPIAADKKSVKISHNSALISGSGLIKTLIWSAFFVILISYFSVFGVWNKLSGIGGNFSLPGVMLQNTFNPVSGSMEGLAMFLAVMIVFSVGKILIGERKKSKLSLFINYLLLVAAAVLLLIIDFSAAWIVLLVTLGLFTGFALWKRIFRENVNRLLLPIFLIALAIFCLATDVTRNILVTLPQEQVLSQGTSWSVSFKSLTSNVKNGFLGSGPGTFFQDFTKFKSEKFNQSWLWQIRFDRAGSYIAEVMATMGFFGILSYLALIVIFLTISYFLISTIKYQNFQIPLILAFLALILGQFVYYQNTTLAFTFWLVLSLSVVSWQKPIKEKTFSFKDFPELSLIFTVFLTMIGLLLAGCYFFGGRFYLADVHYLEAQRTADDAAGIETLEKAARENPKFPQYRVILARAYLNQVLNEMAKPLEEQDSLLLQNSVAKAIDQAKVATEIFPENVLGWETLGIIYREMRLVADGATEWGIKAFEKAIQLEPVNPILHTELGKLYLTQGEVQKAKEEFAKARELKSDYIEAVIQEALIYERENNLTEAIKKMEEAATNFPYNINVLFQLGRLQFNNNQLQEAINQFLGVISLFPNHSNALYSLGVVYQKKGEKNLAIEAFEKVLELNPGNEEVINRLEELRK